MSRRNSASREVADRRRRAEPRRGVEPQAGDIEAVGNRQVAVPVVELSRLVRVGAQQVLELGRRKLHPDRARLLRRHIAIGPRRIADDGAVGPEDRAGIVVGRLIGAVGRPQRAIGLERLQHGLPGRPVAVEQRRRVVGPRQDEGDGNVVRRRRARHMIGVLDRRRRCRAVAAVVEEGRIADGRHRKTLLRGGTLLREVRF